MCVEHVGKYYSKANYNKNKLQDKPKHDKASRIIQKFVQNQLQKCDKAFWVIQKFVRDWLYRPGSPIMKKAEARFYITASRQ
jgi:hypothetical protein